MGSLLHSLLPFALLFTANLLPVVSAGTIYPRTKDPGGVEAQVDELFKVLSGNKADNIEARTVSLREVTKQLRSRLKNRQDGKLKLYFIEFAGSKGDIGKSMYYLNALETSLQNKILAVLGREKKEFDIHLAIDCDYTSYLSQDVLDAYKDDIGNCGKTKDDFKNAVADTMNKFKPDIVILGHAVHNIYLEMPGLDDDYFKQLVGPIEQCENNDTCVKVNIKSYFKDPQKAREKKDEYKLTRNDITIVGQTADYFADAMPSNSLQVRVGRAPTTGMENVPKPLLDWIKKQQNVMYLGHGGVKRKVEENINNPTPVLGDFVNQMIENRAGDNDMAHWSYILFHNVEAQTDISLPVTNNGRVYHLWYGVSLLSLWNNKKIKIVMHHCGKGSFDDAIIAGKPQICMPQKGFGADMKDWAQQLEVFNIGKGLTKEEDWIEFENPTSQDYQGVQKGYPENAMNDFKQAFIDVKKDIKTMEKNTDPRREALENDTAGKLTIEIIRRMVLGLLLRQPHL